MPQDNKKSKDDLGRFIILSLIGDYYYFEKSPVDSFLFSKTIRVLGRLSG